MQVHIALSHVESSTHMSTDRLTFVYSNNIIVLCYEGRFLFKVGIIKIEGGH